MRTCFSRAVLGLSVLLLAAAASAQSPQGLERVGPVSTANGFPTWYQDKTGVTLDFCQPLTQAELDGGWCLLLPGDTIFPELFPSPFANEHFYWAADAAITSPAINGQLVLGVEAAFALDAAIDGDQMVFARIRIRFDAPVTGTYTVYHPYGIQVVEAVGGERLDFTEDVGVQCVKGTFDCALRGGIGPFLLASSAPGGAELPAVLGPSGRMHIASPDRLGPVTGSPVGQNFFRIVGPGGISAQTSDFALMGRIQQGAMPGRVTVAKARYARSAGSLTGILDVFASAFGSAQPRMPGHPITPAVTPFLGFYPAACSGGAGAALGAPAGVSPVQMFSTGSRYYGQFVGNIPAAVCVQDYTARDANGQVAPAFAQAAVADQVTIIEALFTPGGGGTLSVTATSSDQNLQPVLTASLGGPLTNDADGMAKIVATGVVVPPLMLSVSSAAGGRAELEVSTMAGQPDLGNLPFAGNDAYTINEDSATVAMNVLANDTIGGAAITDPTVATISVVAQPSLGIAVVDALTGAIRYTPQANAFGSDFLSYTVTVGSNTSPAAFVSITIRGVNDAPVANADTASGVGNLGLSVPLLANDTDADGPADLVGVNITSAPAGITYSAVGGVLSFSAPAGTHTFRYRARDAAGALSNETTVTVTLSGGETLSILRAEYVASKRRWRVEGTSSVLGAQTIYVMYANGTFADGSAASGYLLGTAQLDATGAWTMDFTLAGTNDLRNPTSTLFSVRPTRIVAITSLGGSSPTTAFVVR
jgi:hypothetical protein